MGSKANLPAGQSSSQVMRDAYLACMTNAQRENNQLQGKKGADFPCLQHKGRILWENGAISNREAYLTERIFEDDHVDQ